VEGVCVLSLPVDVPGSSLVEVSFDYDRSRVLRVKVRVVGTDRVVEEALQHGRPPVRSTQVEDWREALVPAVRGGRHFLLTFGEFMDEKDRSELEEALARAEKALERDDQVEGGQLTHLLTNKILSSGVASQLFLAELAMKGAAPELVRQLIATVQRVRAACKGPAEGDLEEARAALRMLVAQARAQRARRLEDKGYDHRLKEVD
jgi:hypothetical protein